MIIVFDIDGTLADNTHRAGYINQEPPDWYGFHRPELMALDTPFKEAQVVVPKLIERAHMTAIMTGRMETSREVTTEWLHAHYGLNVIDPNKQAECARKDIQLIMRPDGDFRPAIEYKKDFASWLSKHPSLGTYQRLFFDDETKVFQMYWDHGIPLKAPEIWKTMLGDV